MAVARDELTTCGSCGRETKTVGGLCTHCGVLKDPDQAPPGALEPRNAPRGSVWDDPVLTLVLLALVPGVLLIVAGVALAVPILVVIGLGLLGLALLVKVAGDG
jgi:hypothetical protein